MPTHQFRTHLMDGIPVEVDLTSGKADLDLAVGDLVAKDDTNGYASAVNFTWDTNLATTQAAFAAALIGVSVDRVQAGDPAHYSVDPDVTRPMINQDGTYSVYVEAATYSIGQYLGPSANGGGDGLINQCEAVASKTLATFVVQEDKTASTSDPYVLARLINTPVKR